LSDGRGRKFIRLGELLDDIVAQSLPDDPGLRARLASLVFLRLAGPAVAGRCRIIGLHGDELRVAVDTPRWQQELERLAGDYLRRVNSELPPPLRLAGIRFLRPQKKRKP
jgi:hypothetical protein